MSVAKAYGKALYQAAAERTPPAGLAQVCDKITLQLETVLTILSESQDARVALQSPVTTGKEKAKLIESFGNKLGLDSLVTQFLMMLANKGRFNILAEVRDVFVAVRLAADGGISGDLVSADKVSEADVSALAQAFGKKLSKKVVFKVTHDPKLLAGVKITINGVTYDGTLRAQLARLRDQFLGGKVR